jgi:hypothetical protein
VLVGIVGVFVLSVIAVWIFVARQNPPGLVVLASFWTVVVAVNAYRLLLRYSYELTEVVRVPRDSEVPAGHGDIASHLLDVLDDGESPSCSPG